MAPELAPLRRAHELLQRDMDLDEVVAELRRLFGLDFVDAMAAVAASTALMEAGLTVPEEPFARPYV